jgi:hypothetical protein
MNRIDRRTIICLLVGTFLLEGSGMADSLSPASGTLVIAIPTNQGLVIAADRRTTPRGIFCDGVRKILLPKTAGSAVFVTGMATMSDVSAIPDERLCEELFNTPAPVDFGRATVAFIDKQKSPLTSIDGQQLTEAIFAEVRPYIDGGQLRQFFGQARVTTIVIASFNPQTAQAHIWQFWINFTGPMLLQLQPLPVRTFGLGDPPDIVPFGENDYLAANVLHGIGRQFLDGSIDVISLKTSIAEVSIKNACDASVNLIEAATKTADLIKPPSGIGGGIDCAVIGPDTKFLEPHKLQ